MSSTAGTRHPLPRPAPADLVVDTSAVVAVMMGEPTSDRILAALRASSGPIISAASLLELCIVAESRTGAIGSASAPVAAAGAQAARAVLDAAGVVTAPVDETITEMAMDAWLEFGKGRHSAGLNFGDCFAYATAFNYEVPLLYVGDDFAATDIPSCLG